MRHAVIFDLDGTLLDTVEDLAYSANTALTEHGYPIHETEKYHYFVGKGAKNLIKNVLPEHTSEETKSEVLRRFGEIYANHWNVDTKPYAGITELLAFLKEDGVGMAVISNKPHDRTLDAVDFYFPRMFDVVFGERPNAPLKPDPTSIYEILTILDVKREDVIYIGDSGSDMKTGRNADVYSIGAVWGFRTAEELTDNGADILAYTAYEAKKIIADRFFG
ncbi:MAG: HAD family hydrolase [Clostridiales bacterium]|jgi:phosphoglycolate phosphatase|nr:HAD family hydrolase [Clostridiales bacterium]